MKKDYLAKKTIQKIEKHYIKRDYIVDYIKINYKKNVYTIQKNNFMKIKPNKETTI